MRIPSLNSGENSRTRFESKEAEEILEGKKDIFVRFGLPLNEKMAGIVNGSFKHQQFSGSGDDDDGDYTGPSGGCGGGIHRKPSR